VIDRRIAVLASIVVGFAGGWFLRAGLSRSLTAPGPERTKAAGVAAPAQQPLPAKPVKQAFEDIYKNAIWGRNAENAEHAGNSGTGSTMSSTIYWRLFLTEFLNNNHITSVVDAGCGDWEFSQSIDWTGIDYKGYDIVEAVVEADRKKYEKPNIHFFAADMIGTELPPADLLISKHVLQHLPNDAVKKFMTQFGKYRNVLLVNGVHPVTLSSDNPDIAPGGYRALDITAPPFNLRGAKVLTYWDGMHMHQVVHIAGHR
jgi:SAM-dependent methyltransferase